MFSWQISAHVQIVNTIYKIPFLGKYIGLILDRFLFMIYGIELESRAVQVDNLDIPHPGGVLLGGNSIVSKGPLVIMSGVKFVAKNPIYLENYLKKNKAVFQLGQRIFVGANSVIIGPIKICNDVTIGAMSVVLKDIDNPGTYAGIPARLVSKKLQKEWFTCTNKRGEHIK